MIRRAKAQLKPSAIGIPYRHQVNIIKLASIIFYMESAQSFLAYFFFKRKNKVKSRAKI